MLTAQESVPEEESKEETTLDEKLEQKITENKIEKPQKNTEQKITKYVVEIPAGTKLDQIHKLKEFLSSQTP